MKDWWEVFFFQESNCAFFLLCIHTITLRISVLICHSESSLLERIRNSIAKSNKSNSDLIRDHSPQLTIPKWDQFGPVKFVNNNTLLESWLLLCKLCHSIFFFFLVRRCLRYGRWPWMRVNLHFLFVLSGPFNFGILQQQVILYCTRIRVRIVRV